MSTHPERSALAVALAALGAIVFALAVPGVFTVDDNNYLINVLTLRQGSVTLANTDGLSPSRELLFFDPGMWTRAVNSTPVASSAPPLYGLLALPFSFFEWRGLVALNTLAYILTTWLVFRATARHSARRTTPWLAALAFALCGFVIEYAQGVWPHSLSLALCTGGILAAGRNIEGRTWRLSALSGVLLALATGVRYQNAAVIVAVGCSVWLLSSDRWRSTLAFCVGCVPPLVTSAAINHARLGSWNPISKGPGYLSGPAMRVVNPDSPIDPFVMFWARLVDFSARPQLSGPTIDSWLNYDPASGAHLMLGLFAQKSFLQSAPWAVVGFVFMLMAWRRGRVHDHRRAQLRLMSLVTGTLFVVFSVAGVNRHEGLAFNQRYLLELLPLVAIAFAWAVDGVQLELGPLLTGAALGVVAVLLVLVGLPLMSQDGPLWAVRLTALFKVPLVLSLSLLICWMLVAFRGRHVRALSLTAGLCLAWGLTIHLADDVFASHRTRRYNLKQTEQLSQLLPDHSALIAYWWHKDPAVPLLFDRDIVILDVVADDGEDAPVLIRELLARGRRVFLLPDNVPQHVLERAAGDHQTSEVGRAGKLRLLELRAVNEAGK